MADTPHNFESNWWEPDRKYSLWRRNFPFRSRKIRSLYCTDIDWVEWRGGKPAAIIETTRCYGKDPEQCLKDYMARNKGFQAEVAFKVAKALEIPAYIILVEDPEPDKLDDYKNARFCVAQLIEKDLYVKVQAYKGPEAYLDFLRTL